MFDPKGTGRTGWDKLPPVANVVVHKQLPVGETRLLIDLRWPRRALRRRACQSACSRVRRIYTGELPFATPKSRGERKGKHGCMAQSAVTDVARPADIGMN
jgi:hypothetical protein